jgi:hypothetical protein
MCTYFIMSYYVFILCQSGTFIIIIIIIIIIIVVIIIVIIG